MQPIFERSLFYFNEAERNDSGTKKLIEQLSLNPGAASKYRMAIRASNLAPLALAFGDEAADAENSSLKIA